MKEMITGAPPPPREEEQTRSIEADEAEARFSREIYVGTVTAVFGTSVVIEMEIPFDGFALAFKGLRATVHLADGTTVDATIDPGASTHEGTYAIDLTIRLTLQLAAPPAADVEMVLLKIWSAGVDVLARA
jgi:hypothetical protein